MKKENHNELILKYALQNAVFYEGSANSGAVLGKIMASEPELRTRVNEVKKEIEKIVKEVNRLSLEKQKERLQELAPELLEKEEKKQEELPSLHNAVTGKVVTRFAPSPTGPLNLPQVLRAAFLSYLYAKKYKGTFILRIEDTDPANISKEHYEWIKEDLKSVGIKWDRLTVESGNMDLYYKHAEELIKKGDMYSCSCKAEKFKEYKEKRQSCPCRDRSPKENLNEWRKALDGKYSEGKIVVRLKTSMKDPNPALRDPPMLRITKTPHPLRGRKYNMWPLYNYANTIEDHNSGITHVFRGKEHEHNTAVQRILYQKLGWNSPDVINFGMIYLSGQKLHTSEIKELIKNRKFSGWDDIRLPTVRAFVRRGFQPEAFRQASLHCSLTKTDISFNTETFESMNRKIIDPVANRYMIVINPAKISVRNSPVVRIVEENLHPDFPKRGFKKLPVSPGDIYISKDDSKNLNGKEFRLKGFGNIKLKGNIAEYSGNDIEKDMQKVQWVSVPNVKVKIVKPDGVLEGLGEINLKKLKPGELIQMERIGFGKIEKIMPTVEIIFAHR